MATIAVAVAMGAGSSLAATAQFPGGRVSPGGTAGSSAPQGTEPPRIVEEVYQRGVEHVDLERLDELYRSVDRDVQDRVRLDFRRFLTTAGREGLPSAEEVLDAAVAVLTRELVANARTLARIVALSLLGAVLAQLGKGVGGQGVQDVAQAAVLVALVWIGLESLTLALRMVGQSVQQMSAIAQAVMPTLSSLALLAGAGPASLALHPVLLGVVTLAATVLERVVVPGLVIGGGLAVAGHVAPDFPISRLSSLVHQLALTALGLTLTILLGATAVRGVIAPVADGVALRTVKYLTGATVPVVGRMMSEAVEVVAGGSTLIRSGIGVIGLALVMLAALAPVLKLLAVIFVYRLASAVLQPVSDPRIVGALGAMGDTLGLLLSALAATVVVFVLALAATIGAGTMAVLAR